MRVKAKHLHHWLHISLFLALMACKEEEHYTLTGDFMGRVYNYTTVEAGHRGIEIVMEGSKPEARAVTDSSGRFIIESLKSGTYNIHIQKEGYLDHRINGYTFVGGSKPTFETLGIIYQVPEFKIVDLSLNAPHFPHDNRVHIITEWTGEGDITFRYFLSGESDVSYRKYEYSEAWQGHRVTVQIDTLVYPRGSEIFLVAYPAASSSDQSYIDIENGMPVYTAVNSQAPSDVVSFVIP